jgi:hypothetical protein
MPEEKPTIEQPTIEKPAKPNEVLEDAEALLAELKKLDIQTPTDVQNMAQASELTGKAWNEVGELRKQVSELTAQLPQKQAPQEPEYYDGESVDIGALVESKVQGVLNNYLESQQKAQQMAVRAMSEVRNDPEYGMVGKVFEEYISTPEATTRLQSGETTLKTEWLNTKAAYFKKLAQRSSKTLEGLMDKGVKAPPHIEASGSDTAPMTNTDDEQREKFNKIKKAQKDGDLDSDKALEQIIKTSMPDVEKDISFFMP